MKELRLIEVYKGGHHQVFHIVQTGQHIKLDETGRFFDQHECWHYLSNPCKAVLHLERETDILEGR